MLGLGAADFLLKPVTGARLREAVLRALDNTPVPLFLVEGDDARRDRVQRLLEETGLEIDAMQSLAEAVGIPSAPPPIILLGTRLVDGDAGPLLARWSADPAFHGATVILMGAWHPESVRVGPGCHVEILRGQRAGDAAGRVRALIAKRRGPRRSGTSG